MRRADPLESAIRRDRAILLGGLLVTAGLAWASMARMASGTEGGHAGHALAMPHLRPWGAWELLAAFAMWCTMMVAMMLPIVTPWLLVLSRAKREREPGPLPPSMAPAASGHPWPSPVPFGTAGFFVAGYMAVWGGYAALAALSQWGLAAAALLSPGLVARSPALGGALLLAAGVYQWTPWRDACMNHCRSPLGFFLASWRDGARGAALMGFRHGLYCVGCCGALMALSFVFGVMNLLWMAGITAFLLVEKIIARGPWFGRIAGALLAGWGLWMALGHLAFR